MFNQEETLIPFNPSRLPPDPWLVFAPHADDETFGMGGAILKAKEQDLKTHLVVLTDGSQGGKADGLVEIPKVPKIDYSYLNPIGAFFMLKHYSGRYPKIFEGINIKDMQRVSRAISVYDATGITLSDWQKKKNKKYFEKNEFIKICLLPPKQELEKRIEKRFLEMLKNGAIKEAKKYRELGLSMYSLYTANKIIGLEQIASFIDKKISMKELKEAVFIKTRQYAKRQYTWQRGQMKDWKGFTDINYLDLRKKILSYLSKT